MSKHIPGPWRIHPKAETAVIAADGSYVASAGGHSNNMRDAEELWQECCANARLIASAPDLLEKLEEAERAIKACDDTGFYSEFRESIRTAINAARGK